MFKVYWDCGESCSALELHGEWWWCNTSTRYVQQRKTKGMFYTLVPCGGLLLCFPKQAIKIFLDEWSFKLIVNIQKIVWSLRLVSCLNSAGSFSLLHDCNIDFSLNTTCYVILGLSWTSKVCVHACVCFAHMCVCFAHMCVFGREGAGKGAIGKNNTSIRSH